MNLLWSPLALERVQEIAGYIAEDDPNAAKTWVQDLFAAVGQLQDFPNSGRQVPEIKRKTVREMIWRQHRIIYKLQPGQVSILTVIRSRQQFNPTLIE